MLKKNGKYLGSHFLSFLCSTQSFKFRNFLINIFQINVNYTLNVENFEKLIFNSLK